MTATLHPKYPCRRCGVVRHVLRRLQVHRPADDPPHGRGNNVTLTARHEADTYTQPAYQPSPDAICTKLAAMGADGGIWVSDDRDDTTLAASYCAICPDQVACAAWALNNGEPEGVWGGTTPRERSRTVPDTKPCAVCGTSFDRGPLSYERWITRRYCSHACAQVDRRALSNGAKTCAVCEKPYVRREKESSRDFTRRRYCSRGCARIGSNRARAASQAAEPDRACLHCGTTIPHEGTQPNEYRKRKFCTKSCAAKHNRARDGKARGHDTAA